MMRTPQLWRCLPACVVLCLAAACAPPSQPSGAASASGQDAGRGATRLDAPPRVRLPDGTDITLELATTPEERAQGLMFRTSLGEGRGMLFVFETVSYPSFWMKDTWLPLDILYIDEEGVVREIKVDVQPCPAEPCPHYVAKEPVIAVLELAAGAVTEHGLEPGAVLEFERVPGF